MKRAVASSVLTVALLSGCSTNSPNAVLNSSQTNPVNTIGSDSNSSNAVHTTDKTKTPPNPITVQIPNTTQRFNLFIKYPQRPSSLQSLRYPSDKSYPSKAMQWDIPSNIRSYMGSPSGETYNATKINGNSYVFRGLTSPNIDNATVAWKTPIGHIMVIPSKDNGYEIIFFGLSFVDNSKIINLESGKSAKFISQKGQSPSIETWLVKSGVWYRFLIQGTGSVKTIVFPEFKIAPR